MCLQLGYWDTGYMVLELGRGLAVAVEWGETHQLPAPGREHLWSVIALFATADKLLSLFIPDRSILTAETF